MSKDLTEILNEWPYDSENTLRIIEAEDGRNVLQVRQPLGIEQYELEGRPDGEQPFDKESVVQEIEDRLSSHVEQHGSDEGFEIGHDEATELHNEGVLFYYRYLLLYQMNDFQRVTRDTEHNLRLCSLLEKYCHNENDRNAVLQFKPYIIRMNAMARSMISIQSDLTDVAREILESAIHEIENLENIESPAFHFERIRSTNYLKSALEQLDEGDDHPSDDLRQELEQAVEEEDYERAAELRDQLRNRS
jgi:excinuclease UvrABC helicase subunit UvrB